MADEVKPAQPITFADMLASDPDALRDSVYTCAEGHQVVAVDTKARRPALLTFTLCPVCAGPVESRNDAWKLVYASDIRKLQLRRRPL